MAFYECTFIARQDISNQDVNKHTERFIEIFQEFGGKLIKREYWGLRSLAYIIKKNKKGHYIMLGVEANADAIKEFERNCKINEDILKYMSLRVEHLDDSPSIMMQAPSKPAPRAFALDEMM